MKTGSAWSEALRTYAVEAAQLATPLRPGSACGRTVARATELLGLRAGIPFAVGALDVYTAAIQMKKHRPGVLLSVLAPVGKREELEAVLFRETGTLGVRRYAVERSKLRREAVTVQTPWGPVKGKRGWREGGPEVFSPEYEDCARVARQHGVPLREVYTAVKEAFKR